MIKLTNQQLILIEKYSSNQMNIEEDSILKTIPNWEETAHFHQHFLDVIPVFKMEQIKSRLFLFEEEFQKQKVIFKKMPRRKHILDKIRKQIELSLDELTALFMSVPNYSQVLRSRDLIVIQKQGETSLFFELKQTTTRPFQIIIEDNSKTLLVKQEVPANRQRFEVSLENIKQIPGRYYWKAKPNKELMVGEFFIQKELMP